MPIPEDGFARVAIKITNFNVADVDYITWFAEIAQTTPAIINARDVIEAAIVDIAQDMGNAYAMQSVVLTFGDGDGGEGSVELPFSSPIIGSAGSDGVDPRAAVTYKKTTIGLGRHYTGRFFLPGVVQGDLFGDGTLDATNREDRTNHAATFLDKLNTPAGDLDPVPMLLQRTGPAGTGFISTVIQLTAQPTVAWLRRRRNGN